MLSAALIGALLLAAPPLPFDVVSDNVDPFNPPLLLNPRWGLQSRTRDPDRLPAVGHDCRLNEGSINEAHAWTTGQAPCTSYSVGTTEAKICGGHVNWFPVVYEGNLCWQDHHGGILGDDDYNFRVLRNDRALHTGISPVWVIAEFDSDETVDRFDAVPWWRRFHRLVDEEDHAGGRFEGPRSEICGKRASVIGLVSYDTAHGGHAELHPVYAASVHVNEDPKDDTWVFFVRNWGNQGGCAEGEYRLDSPNPISLFFPRPGASGLTYGAGSVLASNSSAVRTERRVIKGRGFLVTVTLPNPDEHAWLAGEVHLRWDDPTSLPPMASDAGKIPLTCALNGCWPIGKHGAPVRAKEDEDDVDWAPPLPVSKEEHAAIERAVEHLDPHQRALYWTRYRELRRADLEAAGIIASVRIDRLPRGDRPEVSERRTASDLVTDAPAVRLVHGAANRATRQLEALCAATDGKIGATHFCQRIERLGVNEVTLRNE